MLRSRLLAIGLAFALSAGVAAASDESKPGEAQRGGIPAGSIPPPPPQEPLAAELTHAPVGFAPEFAQRLSVEGNLRGVERTDRLALKQFYEERRNEPVWVNASGYTPAAQSVLAEIARAEDWGLEASAFQLPAPFATTDLTREQRADAEIMLSLAVLRYARYARGGRVEPLNLSYNLDRRPQLLDPASVMLAASKAENPDAYLRSLHPQHPQFERLRQRYVALKRGKAEEPEKAAKVRGKKTKQAAQPASAAATLRTLLVNMEQWRWMPEDLGSFYVWVNIPEFTVRVIKNGRTIHSERVVVGRPNTQTPVFSDEMKQVIFHPYWGVPDSIKKNELLPSLARGNTDILERHNLRISYRGRDINPSSVDWSRADLRKFHVYQPPGRSNVLGVVKFRFPNKHDVYMHDTPSKNLFNASVRTFSHGCMRVRDPLKLAEIVLAEDRGWPAGRVAAAVSRGPKDNQINLTTKVPVHMTYFTAWVDDEGRLRTFADIYGHENRIAAGIAGKPLPAQREPESASRRTKERGPAARTAATSSDGRGRDRDWMRRVFQY